MSFLLLNQPNILGSPGYVASVADDYLGRKGLWTAEGGGDRRYVNRLKIQTTSNTVGPVAILCALPVRLGDIYAFPLVAGSATENDTGSFCQAIELDQDSDDGRQWVATLSYDHFHIPHELGTSLAYLGVFDPLQQVPVIEWSENKYERHKAYDETPTSATGVTPATAPKPYVNTVGDPLEDPPKTEETRPLLKYSRAEAIYNDDYAALFKDAVNSDAFQGYPPNTVKCMGISAERRYTADWGYYWWVTYQFEFRDDDDGNGYTELILNAGYRQLVPTLPAPNSTIPQDIICNGSKVSQPVALQQNGQYLPLNPTGTPPISPYYLQFQQFPSMAFELLNIPDGILIVNQ